MAAEPDHGNLTLAAIAAASVVILAAFGLPLLRQGPEVVGGVLLEEDPDSITVRCIGPEVVLRLNGFEGDVNFTNCFPNATLTGWEGPIERIGSTISCDIQGPVKELRVHAETEESLRFAVIGDSHGRNDILAAALREAEGCEFVFHCGDMTPSGQPSEYEALEVALGISAVPVMTTPGNHDVKLGGDREYQGRFGPGAYSFEYSGTVFASVDSSDQVIDDRELDWLKDVFEGAQRKIMVTHMPFYDPFGDNHTLEAASCERVRDFVLEEGIDAVFTGHIHAFSQTRLGNTDLVISGGAGGALVDGVHHIVVVTLDESGLMFEKVDLGYFPPQEPHVRVIGKDGVSVDLTYEQMRIMGLEEGVSSYENLYGNTDGRGHYSGALVRDLLGLVGGMAEGDLLTISSSDGYSQQFGYLNAYPDDVWLDLQGEMILAIEFEGLSAPDWAEGPRLAMLPEDGLYSNSDCELTSYEGQGYSVYPSAGARWVKNTVTITVEAAP